MKRGSTPTVVAAGLLFLTLMLAPQAGVAAPFAAKASDAIGRWAGDAKNPAKSYEVLAGPTADEVQLVFPAADETPPIVLHRIGANTFSSPAGAAPTAKLTITSARSARLYVHGRMERGVVLTYLLLNKQ